MTDRPTDPRPVWPSPTASRSIARRPALWAALAGAALLGLAAVANARQAARAERRHPPLGRVLTVQGVRLHYLERGAGPPLVLLHGNGAMIEDFLSSGLVDEAARSHRVIAFDRPGYGHSERPRGRVWTPDAQADLLAAALARLGVARAVVLGHSWGTLVAVALAHRHPGLVAGLVLEGGYYYPTPRIDVVPMALPALPVAGDVLRYTIAPPLSRLLWPLLLRAIFGPASVPAKFAGFPREMALRPSQIRASAEESALMIPAAFAARDRYACLRLPVAIIAGAGDRVASSRRQSARLHREIAHSSFDCLPATGHMVHQTATAAVMAAVAKVAAG